MLTNPDWRAAAETAEERLHALRAHATRVFGEPKLAERWLNRPNPALEWGEAPAVACATVHGFFRALADLSQVERFEQREAQKRARFGENGRTGYIRLRA